MKLRKVSKTKVVSHSDLIPNHACRYCHYYEHGKCYHPYLTHSYVDNSMKIYKVAEDGTLSEALKEVMADTTLHIMSREIKNLLTFHGLSNKKAEEVLTDIMESIEVRDNKLIENLDDKISVVYQKAADEVDEDVGVEIAYPDEFYCKEFW